MNFHIFWAQARIISDLRKTVFAPNFRRISKKKKVCKKSTLRTFPRFNPLVGIVALRHWAMCPLQCCKKDLPGCEVWAFMNGQRIHKALSPSDCILYCLCNNYYTNQIAIKFTCSTPRWRLGVWRLASTRSPRSRGSRHYHYEMAAMKGAMNLNE